MEKKVLLTIISSQSFQNQAPEVTELVTEGRYEQDGEIIRLSYVESELTGLEGTVTTFTVEKSGITLSRKGELQSEIHFVVGKEDRSLYDMGFGALMITVRTEQIESDLTEDGGSLSVTYGIGIEEQTAGNIRYLIRVQPL